MEAPVLLKAEVMDVKRPKKVGFTITILLHKKVYKYMFKTLFFIDEVKLLPLF